MSQVVVKAEGVGKKYLIRHQGKYGYVSLRDVIADGAANAARRLVGRAGPVDTTKREEIWAVRDVSFELHEGDRIGLIGRNGAGKSTLLKILSRITEPSAGSVRIRGRVASLLEVGTGFHPELTGRENVFLNGTVLGMRRAEIRRKFDEIVAFAEVEQFLDTPVKRYSSGMYVRLAFAVAAHLDQEILLVDEVLAVGDAAFQQKCLTKMGEVAREGKTIILVSHYLAAVDQLCTTALWLDGGRTVEHGKASEVVRHYNASFAPAASGVFKPGTVLGDGAITLLSYSVSNAEGGTVPLPVTGEDILIKVCLRVNTLIQRPAAGVSIWAPAGILLTSIDTLRLGQELAPWEPGERTVSVWLRNVPFMPGTHRLDFWASPAAVGGHLHGQAEDAITFEVGHSPLYGSTGLGKEEGPIYTRVELTSAASTDSRG